MWPLSLSHNNTHTNTHYHLLHSASHLFCYNIHNLMSNFTVNHTHTQYIIVRVATELLTHILEISAADDQTNADSVESRFLLQSAWGNPALPLPLPHHLFIVPKVCISTWTSEHLHISLYISFTRHIPFHFGALLFLPLSYASLFCLLYHLCRIRMPSRKCVCSAACTCECMKTVSSCMHDSLRSLSQWLDS